MSRSKTHRIKRSTKTGLPPGTPVYIGRTKETTIHPRMTVIEYDGNTFAEREVSDPKEWLPLKPAPTVTWINIDAIHDANLLSQIGALFNLHPLLLEDMLNTDQRPKCEVMDDRIYIILKMFDFNMVRQELLTEQVSLVIGENFLMTFHEEVGNEFEIVRERLRQNNARIRKGNSGYLAYSLIDTVVDRYFMLLEKIGESLEDIEEDLTLNPKPEVLQSVHRLKRELIFLRKYIWPVREVIGTLRHSDSPLLNDQTILYLGDVYDHTIQAMDTLETYRDLVSGIQDLYLSVMSNRMNEIMKVLTIMSTLFIPLTFLVGVYGMNFKYMPELAIPWAYPAVWGVMLLSVIGMIAFFKRKHWV